MSEWSDLCYANPLLAAVVAAVAVVGFISIVNKKGRKGIAFSYYTANPQLNTR